MKDNLMSNYNTIDPSTKSFKPKNDQLRSNTYLIKPYNFDTKSQSRQGRIP